MPHSKVAMKGLGKEKKRLCCLTFQLFHTDGGVTEYGRKHTKTHTHTHTHTFIVQLKIMGIQKQPFLGVLQNRCS